MQDVVNVREGLRERRLHQNSDLLSYPEKWDWREKGLVTDVSYFFEKQGTSFKTLKPRSNDLIKHFLEPSKFILNTLAKFRA